MSKDTESQHSEASPQHTPGPWVWDGGMICHDTADGGVELVAYLVRGYTTDSDLALITAAPDLLETLKSVLADAQSIDAELWEQARNAIAKAEGRQQ